MSHTETPTRCSDHTRTIIVHPEDDHVLQALVIEIGDVLGKEPEEMPILEASIDTNAPASLLMGSPSSTSEFYGTIQFEYGPHTLTVSRSDVTPAGDLDSEFKRIQLQLSLDTTPSPQGE